MALKILTSPEQVRQQVHKWRGRGADVGLVPTMGALHEGHLSLVRASAEECDHTVVSIFVNPTQFPPGEDFQQYPRRLDEDCTHLGAEGADLVFAPTEDAMYPPGACTWVVQEDLSQRLCGRFREGHFRGVLTVVAKLFHIVPADRAYFGRKDFQQSVLIRRMVQDLNMPMLVRVMPTVREADGLAISSRNEYLTPRQRKQAVCLYEALQDARTAFRDGERRAERLIGRMRQALERCPEARPQYVEIVQPEGLQAVDEVSEDCVAAMAVFVGEARLIDNMPFGECEDVFVDSDP